jgi:hypothetical protein
MFTNSFPQTSLYDQVAKGEDLEAPLVITQQTHNPQWNGSLIAQELSAKYDLHSAWADRWAIMEWACHSSKAVIFVCGLYSSISF